MKVETASETGENRDRTKAASGPQLRGKRRCSERRSSDRTRVAAVRTHAAPWDGEGRGQGGGGLTWGRGSSKKHWRFDGFLSHSLDLLGDRSAPGVGPQRPSGPAAAEVAVC